MISPLFPGSPLHRQPPAKPCQCQLRGNLCTGRRLFSSSFPCQAPQCASHWRKLRFEMLFVSFCQHNIWNGCTLCDILVVNKQVHSVRKILHGNEMVCNVCLPLEHLLNYFSVFFLFLRSLWNWTMTEEDRTSWEEPTERKTFKFVAIRAKGKKVGLHPCGCSSFTRLHWL